MKVIKLGGGCLKDAAHFKLCLEVLRRDPQPHLVVVSAIQGVTDMLIRAMDQAVQSENEVAAILADVRGRHERLIEEIISDENVKSELLSDLGQRLQRLERLLFGIAYTGEISGSLRALVSSFGERLAALLFAGMLRGNGVHAEPLDADEIGTTTDSDSCENATADLDEVRRRFSETVMPLLRRGIVPVVTGFFGCTPDGKVTTFGRNGSDYSASVFAYAIGADAVEIWKDVDGFMSADPKMTPAARRIERLSYYEAAELSYFGARILHPRTVEPLVESKIPIFVRNLFDPESPGTVIVPLAEPSVDVIKSVTCNRAIAVLRIHGPGVGCKPGIIGQIGDRLSAAGVNIVSIITAQTCINLLVEKADARRGLEALRPMSGGVIERVDLEEDVALIAVVGDGLLKTNGVAAKVFSAVSREKVNVEMFSAGASEVAYYFIIDQKDVAKAVQAIHREFFEIPPGEMADRSRQSWHMEHLPDWP